MSFCCSILTETIKWVVNRNNSYIHKRTTRVKCYSNTITTYKNSQEPIGLFVTQLQVNLVHILKEKNKHKYVNLGIHQNN